MQSKKKKTVIGLTGGVGSGKSRILAILKEEYGACTIMADEEAKELMKPGREGYEAVLKAFGETILGENASFDKQKLSDLIFQDQEARRKMDGIIHPLVWRQIDRKISASQSELIVVEFAIMDFEQHDLYDELWYVYASKETRVRRLLESRGYTRKRTEDMMMSQLTETDYRKRCDRVIDNEGSVEEVKSRLSAILKDRGQSI